VNGNPRRRIAHERPSRQRTRSAARTKKGGLHACLRLRRRRRHGHLWRQQLAPLPGNQREEPRLRSRHGPRGLPVTYDELEPCHVQAEWEGIWLRVDSPFVAPMLGPPGAACAAEVLRRCSRSPRRSRLAAVPGPLRSSPAAAGRTGCVNCGVPGFGQAAAPESVATVLPRAVATGNCESGRIATCQPSIKRAASRALLDAAAREHFQKAKAVVSAIGLESARLLLLGRRSSLTGSRRSGVVGKFDADGSAARTRRRTRAQRLKGASRARGSSTTLSDPKRGLRQGRLYGVASRSRSAPPSASRPAARAGARRTRRRCARRRTTR
jgi:hypothetical protein